MRPYIHHIYSMKDGTPDKKIATIKGKKNFKEWVKGRYFKDGGSPICFCLEEGQDSIFYMPIPFFYKSGKEQIVFIEIDGGKSESVI